MKWLIGAILVVILAIWLLVKVVKFSLATIGGLLGVLVALVAGAIVLSLILYLFRLVRSKQQISYHLTEMWGDFYLMLDIDFFVWYTVFTIKERIMNNALFNKKNKYSQRGFLWNV